MSILLTTFDTWKPTQPSNSSDDLITELVQRKLLPPHTHLSRNIPVDFQLAPEKVLAVVDTVQPDVIVCCGMAEKRSHLTVEANGRHQGEILYTSISLKTLVEQTQTTAISHNTGRFVCNYLYYSVLKYIQSHQLKTQCLFVHVPPLNPENLDAIVQDFSTILKLLQPVTSS
ncbi:peptidase C15 [Phormidium sp. CLA17]|uniref:pyroglutamyl-peptidase I family protein n=1 Tax=Leptolyngbya sp. Cla-17 TaxID=2803751 RepID=UPI0014908A91|nr:peptidase C15 [Leptolyngbya sp. Cla-17]MBM0743510.1 peptidase C15 [Leptolyngbya sp. Cla-17]